MSDGPFKRFARLRPVGTLVVGLILVFLLFVLSRASSEDPQVINAAETSAETDPAGRATEPVAELPVAGGEPTRPDGCFRTGSSRDEVRAVMGAPDSVDFGAWVYGQSFVTFGYGVVLDYSNEGDNLKLC